MTRAISLVGRTRSPIKSLIDPIASAQQLVTSPIEARCVIRPSLPTTRPIRSSSRAMRWLVSITVLNVSAILPGTPTQSSGSRAEKSPRLNAINAASSSRVLKTFSLVCGRFCLRVFLVRGAFFIEVLAKMVVYLPSRNRGVILERSYSSAVG